jgi:mitochondrial fission protein ELM1
VTEETQAGAPNCGSRECAGPLAPLRIWVVTDGKAGDEIPCLGVAEELLGVRSVTIVGSGAPSMEPRLAYPAPPLVQSHPTGTIEIRRVAPRRPWVWLMPRGPIDPRDRPDHPDSPIHPPFPDILIASGRRAVAYARAVKAAAGDRTFAAILKDPRTADHGADFVWVPEHDRARNPHFMRTLTTPHRFSQARIAASRAELPTEISTLPSPRVALLLGGRTRMGPFSANDCARLCAALRQMRHEAGSFLITASRRTPAGLIEAVKRSIGSTPNFIWDKCGPNPYLAILAGSDAIVATGDSHTMISEAAAAGTPLLIFAPHCVKPKLTYFGLRMIEEGLATFFDGHIDAACPASLDSTPIVAGQIRTAFEEKAAQMRRLQGKPGRQR